MLDEIDFGIYICMYLYEHFTAVLTDFNIIIKTYLINLLKMRGEGKRASLRNLL